MNMQTADIHEEVIDCQSRPATEMEVFAVDWAKDTMKRQLPFLNETLARLVTLNSALLGGGIYFMKADQALMLPEIQKTVIACFLAALAVSLSGVLPYQGTEINMRCPDQIFAHKAAAFRYKNKRLRLAGWLMLAGFVLAIVGLWLGV